MQQAGRIIFISSGAMKWAVTTVVKSLAVAPGRQKSHSCSRRVKELEKSAQVAVTMATSIELRILYSTLSLVCP